MTETQAANLGLFRIQRKEEWTSVCYDVSWGITFKKDATLHRPVHETDRKRGKKETCSVFQAEAFVSAWLETHETRYLWRVR